MQAAADGIGTHEEVVRTGRPGDEILRFAEERRAGLAVVGAHGRRIGNVLQLGSTADQVVRGARCPVLTARERP